MSTVTDKARDFWDRISPRERRLVVIAAIAAPITLAIWLGLAIHDGLVSMEGRNDKARKALVVVADMRARGQSATDVDDAVKSIPNEPLSLNTYITNAAKKAKFPTFTSTLIPHSAQPPKNGFVTNSSSVRIDKLTIQQVKDFLMEIETGSKAVAITHLDLRRDFRDKDKLTLDLEVSTYSKEAQAKDSGSGAGSAGSGGKKGN